MSEKYEWNLDKDEGSMPGMVAFDPDTMKGFIDQGFMKQLGDGLFEFHTTAELGKPVRYRGQLQNGQFVFQAIAENTGLKQAAIHRGNFEVGTQDGRLYGRRHGQGYEAELRQDPNGGLAGNLDVALSDTANMNLRAGRQGAGFGAKATRPLKNGELSFSGQADTQGGWGVGVNLRKDW